MAYREKDTKKWTAQWFETNVMGEKKKRRKRGFETKREALEFERSKKLSNERSMDMKLSDFIEIYFSDKQNDLKDRTIKNKRRSRVNREPREEDPGLEMISRRPPKQKFANFEEYMAAHGGATAPIAGEGPLPELVPEFHLLSVPAENLVPAEDDE